jgi:eukaryotic-like serine/threonine-protein kinase
MPLPAGSLLGPYAIVAPVGAGGMGEVYKAHDARLGRTVAIKLISSGCMKRFEREARAIAALNHPNICTLFDIGPDYLVMEYVEGDPLRGPLPVDDAVALALHIVSALEVAHAKGIIHRDLKPGNILVTQSGVKLLDFGLAKFAQGEVDEITQTLDGTVLGTAAYMSPEQAAGKPVDARSDIFSFGAVLYEMLSGRRVFSGGSIASVLSAVLHDEPAPLQTSPQVERIVMRCLAKHPGQRFQTMAEVKAALQQVSTNPVMQRRSIAVLPFADVSEGKDNEYFSEGLAEEIINALTRIPGLKVCGRTSSFYFRGKDLEFGEIGRRLDVDHVLEGSVRKAGSRIRVTAQLIKVADGFHVWSGRYDRELADVFAVQDEIAAAICESLQLKLSQQPTQEIGHRPELPVYEAYLKGWHQYLKATPESFARAKEYYDDAIMLDPECVLPQHGLGTLYFALAYHGLQPAHEVMPLARAAARKALDIEPSLPEAHALLGVVAATHDYDWEEAGRQFRLAMTAVPVKSAVHFHHAAMYLLPLGRAREAVREMQQALDQDPLNVVYRVVLASCLDAAEMPELAIAEASRALEIDENHWSVHAMLARTYASNGRTAEAIASAERAFQLAPWSPMVLGLLAGLVRKEDRHRAEALVQRLMELPAHRTSIGMSQYHLACSEVEAAADWVERAVEQRALFVLYHLGGPLKPLRSTQRWPKLANMLNLPVA